MIKKKNFLGTLVLVVGNSGSGKDSIITGVINKYLLFPNGLEIRSPARYITRPISPDEKNKQVNPETFTLMKKEGNLALHWNIYGLQYGVPIEIEDWLAKGCIVVVNVSRNIIEIAKAQYERIKVVFIKVPLEITIERIVKRGRESGKNLEERIERAKINQDFEDADLIIDNTGDLNDSIDSLLNFLISIYE